MEKGNVLYADGSTDAAGYRGAISIWKQIADDSSAPRPWRNQALSRMGMADEKLGDTASALSCYYDVIAAGQSGDPDFFWFYKAGFDAGRLLESQKLWNEAINVYQKDRRGKWTSLRRGRRPYEPPPSGKLYLEITTKMQTTKHIKLFIPGPVEVSEKTYRALCEPMIGHRSGDFKKLYAEIQPRLQTLFGTTRPVFLSTSSAWGVIERAIRNLVAKKALNCMCGAFSDKWFDVTKRCGKDAEALQVEWGKPITPEIIEKKLSQGGFDAVTLIHNETSCGMRNPLREIAEIMRKFPDVMFIVDTVSSFSTEPIPMDELGIDVMITGSQKALALPPGLALFSVSERAIEHTKNVSGRGYYFDFVEFAKNQAQDMTPGTPVISIIHALRSKLDDIFSEGPRNPLCALQEAQWSGPRLGAFSRI